MRSIAIHCKWCQVLHGAPFQWVGVSFPRLPSQMKIHFPKIEGWLLKVTFFLFMFPTLIHYEFQTQVHMLDTVPCQEWFCIEMPSAM